MTDVLDLLDAAGLTGRGGAAFSTAVKVRAAREEGAGVIVNACDGEIGAAKDGYVVEHHLAELVRGAELVTPARGRSLRYAAHRGGGPPAPPPRAGGRGGGGVPPLPPCSARGSTSSRRRRGTSRPRRPR